MNFDKSIDPHRPLYHFSPPLGWWGGGPDGTIHHDGEYHVFYQFDPCMGSTSGNASWGHAVSRDLVHWEHRPVAIGPTPFGAGRYAAFACSDLVKSLDRSRLPAILYDREVCFSGSAVIDRGVPTPVYTGILHGLQDAPVMLGRSQCIATSDDGMLTWRKHAANPVIPHPPPELLDPSQRKQDPVWIEGVLPSPRRWLDQEGQDRPIDGRRLDAVEDDGSRGQLTAWHDPHVWREGETWYMGLGCGFLGVGGAVLLYRSPDLVSGLLPARGQARAPRHGHLARPLRQGGLHGRRVPRPPLHPGSRELPRHAPDGQFPLRPHPARSRGPPHHVRGAGGTAAGRRQPARLGRRALPAPRSRARRGQPPAHGPGARGLLERRARLGIPGGRAGAGPPVRAGPGAWGLPRNGRGDRSGQRPGGGAEVAALRGRRGSNRGPLRPP